jgi:hypothetical protein
MSPPSDVLTPDSSEPLMALPAEPLATVFPLEGDVPGLPPLPPPILDAEPAPEPLTLWRLIRGAWNAVGSAAEWCFGVAALIFGLAFLAAVPVLGFLTLGYLLESGGRVARNREVRDALVRQRARWAVSRFFLGSWLALGDALVGVRRAARVGGLGIGLALMLLPLQLVSSLYTSAEIIAPGGLTARVWQTVLAWLAIGVGIHIALACLHGGKVRHFLWPIGNLIWLVRQLARGPVRCYTTACDATWDFVVSLRLPYYFWLGVRGFFGALAWLVVPISLMALGRQVPPVGLVGAAWFVGVLLVLPFLQMRLAVENRFRAAFELGAVLDRLGRAPWAFALAQFVTLLFSLPLYLFKIELIPSEVGGMPSAFIVLVSLVFVIFIFPTRLVVAWAYGCAERRPRASHWIFAATGLVWMVPVTAIYVGFVFLTQYISWKGFASLYEQHAFLLPIPFLGW